MRTAKEILAEVYQCEVNNDDDLQVAVTLSPTLEQIEQAIREGMKEAIIKSAEVAEAWTDTNGEWTSINVRARVDRKSILKLIDQIK